MASKESTEKQGTDKDDPTADSTFNKNKQKGRRKMKNQKPLEAEIRNKKNGNDMMDPVELIFKWNTSHKSTQPLVVITRAKKT